MTKQTFFQWGLFLLALYVFLRWLLTPLLPFLIALLLAVAIEPGVLFCLRRLRFRRKFSAVVFSTLLLHESLSPRMWLGCGLIFLAVLLSETGLGLDPLLERLGGRKGRNASG